VGDEVGPDGVVAFGLFGVVADHEALRPRTLVAVAFPAGGDVYFLTRRLPATAAYRPGRASAAAASVLVWRSFSAWM